MTIALHYAFIALCIASAFVIGYVAVDEATDPKRSRASSIAAAFYGTVICAGYIVCAAVAAEALP